MDLRASGRWCSMDRSADWALKGVAPAVEPSLQCPFSVQCLIGWPVAHCFTSAENRITWTLLRCADALPLSPDQHHHLCKAIETASACRPASITSVARTTLRCVCTVPRPFRSTRFKPQIVIHGTSFNHSLSSLCPSWHPTGWISWAGWAATTHSTRLTCSRRPASVARRALAGWAEQPVDLASAFHSILRAGGGAAASRSFRSGHLIEVSAG